jgi:hypothetical protein
MLGFTALSQAPLSQATTASVALAFLATTLGQSAPGVMLFDAKALHTTASTAATSVAASLLFDAQAAITTADAIANTAISDVLYGAQAYVAASAATASFTTGTLDYEALAHITPTGVIATGEADQFDDVDAKANITPTGSSSSVVVQDVLYNLTANIIQPAVTASFNTGTLDYTLTANITPTGAFATSTASDFGDVDAKANITTVGTSSNTAVNDFADVAGLANVTPSSATAFLSIYIGNFADEDAQATAFIPPAVGTASIKDVDFSADSLITTGSTSALLNISTVNALGGAKATFSGTLANLYNNLLDTTAVKFPYADYADQYNRANTLYIVSYEGSKKVHVVSEDRTVYTESKQDNNIVYITEENYTVYIGKQQGSNTVYIAA